MKQMITTIGRFVNGTYVNRGHLVNVADDAPADATLIPAGDLDTAVVEMAAVGPTGPNPVNPQQVPPDARQTVAGHFIPGARLVGEVTTDEETRLERSGISGKNDGQTDLDRRLAEARTGSPASVAPAPASAADASSQLAAERKAAQAEIDDANARANAAEADAANARKEAADAKAAAEAAAAGSTSAADLLNDKDDNDALVAGTLDEILPTLKDKTPEELAAIRKAEGDRQDARVGLLKAIDKELAGRQSS